jgi:hypothetical protein
MSLENMHYLKPTKKQLVHHLMPQNKKELAILELLITLLAIKILPKC